MKLGFVLSLVGAVMLHAGGLVFVGLYFFGEKEDHGTLQVVELLDEKDAAEKEKPEETTDEKKEDLQTEQEQPPDATEITRSLELSPANDAPALEAASLGAIEAALNGQGGGGDFADALSFSSGGRIGGMGKAGAVGDEIEGAFSLTEIDQKPRVVFQTGPLYPSEMRGKKVEGAVTIIFVADAAGKVENPRVEKSNHAAFDSPALDAVKHWKFEPAVKSGQRVACKMRVTIRFPAS